MRRFWIHIALIGLLVGCGVDKSAELEALDSSIPEVVSFSLHVRPILSDRCFSCHGPNDESRVTDLRFDTQDGLRSDLLESTRSRAVRGGDLADSEMYHRITSLDPAYHMPPPKSNLSLSPQEKAIIVRWIEQGAEYETHWAFTPPVEPPVPDVEDQDWSIDPLDQFILARLRRENINPSAPPRAKPGSGASHLT